MAEYIEREVLLTKIKENALTKYDWSEAIDIDDLEQVIQDVPTADVVAVRHGKWDINRNCSVCGVYKFEGLDADVWADWDINYCPNCGAKMNQTVKNLRIN